MKKLIALLMVCGFALAVVACGKKAEEAAAVADTTATTVEQAVDTAAAVAVDTAAVAK